MSGGSMNYAYEKIEEFASELCDKEMEELATDMAKIFHDAEWWHSADYGEETYRKSVSVFKKKWLETTRYERLKGYIDEIISKARTECMNLIREGKE